MEFETKELEKNLDEHEAEANNESQIEDRKNSSLQNISKLGISLDKVKRVSEAYEKSFADAEDDK